MGSVICDEVTSRIRDSAAIVHDKPAESRIRLDAWDYLI